MPLSMPGCSVSSLRRIAGDVMEGHMFEPTEVRLEYDNIVIEWDDGHRSEYPHRMLRIECPCAGCVEEMTGRRILDVLAVPVDVFAVEYLTIGKYALQFAWSDTHTTGIYPYALLRRMCACGEDHGAPPVPS